MIERRLLRFAVLVTALTAAPCVMHAQVRDSANVVAAVKLAEQFFTAIIPGGDTAALRPWTWPEFEVVSPERTLTPRTHAEWLTATQSERMVVSSMRNYVVRVFARRPPWHRWADLAIVTYLADFRVSAGNGAYRNEPVLITDTWRLDGDRWRILERSMSQGQAALAK